MPSPFQDADAQVPSDASSPSDAVAETQGADASDAAQSGHACLDDSQCDDKIPCTFDSCDLKSKRCSNRVDDQRCQNGRYCDGIERCDSVKGCVPGDPITCSDKFSCTIDRCVEQSLSCEHVPRDVDGDKDPDGHCTGGADCDDNDPTVSSLQKEVCGNGRDDDCDGAVDEEGCVKPKHDTCGDALVLELGKPTVMSMAGSTLDYACSCAPTTSTGLRDVVGVVTVPDGPPMDIDVVAQAPWGQVLTAIAGQCADAASELACGGSFAHPSSGIVSRSLARAVAPGTYPIYVFNDYASEVIVTASLRPASAKPTNETCGSAQPLTPGVPVSASVIGVVRDLGTTCSPSTSELVYSFTMGVPHDVRILATSVDGLAKPLISLRNADCSAPTDELGCVMDAEPSLYRRALAPGKWFVAVGASAPSLVSFNVILEDPSDPAPDEVCQTAPSISSGVVANVSFEKHTADIPGLCGTPSVDAAYALALPRMSDVLLLGRFSQSDQGTVALLHPACGKDDLIQCASDYFSPVRAIRHALTAGDYRAAISSVHGNPASLTAFVRDAVAPVAVVFADRCDDAFDIGIDGGSFEGNTSHSNADYAAGCDQSGGSGFGAPEQMLRLVLPEKRRVILDMQGSAYRTLLNVRKGPSCPGAELVNACAVGYYDQRSFLDLTLEAGTYFIQIDGLAGEPGPWKLDVFTSKL